MNSSARAAEGAPVSTDSSPSAPGRGAVAFALFALYVIWGSTYLAIAIALEGLPPLLLAGARFLTAGALLLVGGNLRFPSSCEGQRASPPCGGTPRRAALCATAWSRARGAMPTRREWGGAAIVGVLLCSGNAFVTVAEQWVSSGMAAVVIASVPLWAALLGGFFGAPPKRGDWPGLLVGLFGVALLNAGGQLRSSPAGAALLVLSTLTWALGSVAGRRLPLPKGLSAPAAQMLCGGAVLLVAALARGERLAHLPPARPLLALAYLVVFGSMVAYSAYAYLLANVRPALATSYAYVNPAVAVALGSLVLREHVSALQCVALLLIVAGVAALLLRRRT